MSRLTLIITDPWTNIAPLLRMLANGDADDHAHYAETGRGPGWGHENLTKSLSGDPTFDEELGGWSDLAAEIACARLNNTLVAIRADHTPARDMIATIKRHLSGAVEDVRAIVIIRPHAERLLDTHGMLLSQGAGPFEARAFLKWALSSPTFRAAEWVGDLRRALGRETVTLIPQCTRHGGKNYVQAFADMVMPGAEFSQQSWASSPNNRERRVMQIFGAAMTMVGGNGLARFMGAEVATVAQEAFGESGEPARWSYMQARDIEQTLAQDAQALDEMMGQHVFIDALKAYSASSKALGGPHPALAPETEIALRAAAHALARKTIAGDKPLSLKSSVNSQAA